VSDTADHLYLSNMIDQTSSLLPSDKRRLKGALAVEKDQGIHLQVIANHIEDEEQSDNPQGVLELLEYRREVIHSWPNADEYEDELAELADRIQTLALRLNDEARARRTTVSHVSHAIPTLEEDRRRPRLPRSRQRRLW